MVLSGRNILALEASRKNSGGALIVPAPDLSLGTKALQEVLAGYVPEAPAWQNAGRRFGISAAFPELLPQSMLPKDADQLASLWEALPPLLAPGGVFIAGFGSTEAERFDRKKPSGFTRLGDIKRKGFRALAYLLSNRRREFFQMPFRLSP
jgi:hypothetical protein